MFGKIFGRYTLCKICLIFLLFLMLLMRVDLITNEDYSDLDGKQVYAVGEVASLEEKTDTRGNLYINIGMKGIRIKDSNNIRKIPGLVAVWDGEGIAPAMGEKICVKGVVSQFDEATNPGEFDGRNYYRALGFCFRLKKAQIVKYGMRYSGVKQFLYELRLKLAERIDRVCGNDSGVMRALLLGDKSKLSPEKKQLYQDGGIAHILAISGLHVSFLGVGLYELLKKLYVPRPLGMLVAAIVMVAFGIMTGGSPSSVRAITMFLVKLLAEAVGRSYEPLTALSLAACILCAKEPRLLFQSGFLLSFGAILGITLIYPMLEDLLPGNELNIYLWPIGVKKIDASGIMASVAVMIMTFPIMLNSYYQFPVYSLVLNVVIIPLLGVVIASGLLAIIVLNSIPFLLGSYSLATFEWLCNMSKNFPGYMWITGKPKEWQLMLYYIIIILILIWYKEGEGYILNPVGIIGFLLAILVVSRPFMLGNQVTFLDVGQGDGIVIRDRYDHIITIDGGSSSESDLYKYTWLPYMKSQGIKKIDCMIFSHTDNDHISGSLELLNELEDIPISVDYVALPPEWSSSNSEGYEKIIKSISKLSLKKRPKVICFEEGKIFDIGDVHGEVMWPNICKKQGDVNGDCLVICVAVNGVKFLFTGDLDGVAEETFASVSKVSNIDILKVGHHGSAKSTGKYLLKNTKPKVAIISVGRNSYGHPNENTLDRLNEFGTKVYRTDRSGAVTIKFKANIYEIEEYR